MCQRNVDGEMSEMDFKIRVSKKRQDLKRHHAKSSNMKLKELMASTLPRSRKAKRKSDSANSSGAKENVIWSSGGKHHHSRDAPSSTGKTPTSRNAFSINFNFNIPGTKCACRKSEPDSDKPFEQDAYFYSEAEDYQASPYLSADIEPETNYNTIPKARSRIRTNPWLPSPKTSPPLSPPSTPMTSLGSSGVSSMTSSLTSSLPGAATPSTPESGIMDTCFPSSSDFCSMDSYPVVHASDQHTFNTQSESPMCYSADCLSDVDSLLQRSCPSAMTSDSVPASDLCSSSDQLMKASSDDMEHDDLVIRIQQSAKQNSLVSTISFEYEEELESRLEQSDDNDLASNNRFSWGAFDISDENYERVDQHNLKHVSRVTDEDDNAFLDDNQPLFSDDDSEDSGSTLCNDAEAICEDVTDSGVGRQRSYSLSKIHADAKTYKSSGRSVSEIQSSLHQKVLKLREEKRLVDEKIRQAREEERVRNLEIERFRQQVVLHRKHVLLDTLRDLREKLSDQGERLQVCYDNVLQQQHEEAVIRSRHGSFSSDVSSHNN